MFVLFALVTTLYLTAKDNNKLFTVKPRTAIVVSLATNPSTGYHWNYDPSPGGAKVVKLVSQRYVPPTVNRPGTPGTEVWHFKVVGRHAAMDLGFLYVQQWKPNKPAQTIGMAIRVR